MLVTAPLLPPPACSAPVRAPTIGPPARLRTRCVGVLGAAPAAVARRSPSLRRRRAARSQPLRPPLLVPPAGREGQAARPAPLPLQRHRLPRLPQGTWDRSRGGWVPASGRAGGGMTAGSAAYRGHALEGVGVSRGCTPWPQSSACFQLSAAGRACSRRPRGQPTDAARLCPAPHPRRHLSRRRECAAAATPAPTRTASSSAGCTPAATARRCARAAGPAAAGWWTVPDGCRRHCPPLETPPALDTPPAPPRHPAPSRQLCKEGAACRRSVCFFAHSVEQLREPATKEEGESPARCHWCWHSQCARADGGAPPPHAPARQPQPPRRPQPLCGLAVGSPSSGLDLTPRAPRRRRAGAEPGSPRGPLSAPADSGDTPRSWSPVPASSEDSVNASLRSSAGEPAVGILSVTMLRLGALAGRLPSDLERCGAKARLRARCCLAR